MLEHHGVRIYWLGHAGFRLEGSKTVYVDPFKIDRTTKPADYIFITHNHFDHCSPADIQRVLTPQTVVICSVDCLSTLTKVPHLKNTKPMAPGQRFTSGMLSVETYPAYNTNKTFHPKANDWLSYKITLDGTSFFHCGDSDVIPEMKSITCDVALVPVSGTYVMTAEEGAEAVRYLKPRIAIPMHYGSIIGSGIDAHKFKGACRGCEVKILDPEA